MAKFIPNLAAPKLLSEGPAMERALKENADAVAERAQETAPVLTGAYRESIRAESESGRAGVVAEDFKAAWIEFGTYKLSGFHTLSRAAEALGLKFRAGRR